MEIKSAVENKTVFIVGSEKNAGKTVFLNFALDSLRGAKRKTRLAFMSTGVDGEKEDLVFGNPKPRVAAKKGELVVTAQSALASTDAGYELLEIFPAKTVLGRAVLVRIVRDGNIEIIGPQSNAHISGIVAALRGGFGAETIIVDGAASRFTQVASADGAEFIYVARVEKFRAQSAAEALRLIYELSRVPAGKTPRGKNVFRIEGALTADKIRLIPKETETVVVEDCTKVFLSLAEWRKFAAKYNPVFERSFRLLFASANLYDIAAGEFAKLLGADFPPDKLVFNPYAL
ncbi:MAG: hypothetical protein PHP45_00295 [Elusimicrobiales bacterium]|nr:hypothetical protein [Elusimicrobiales bacterium]